MIYAIGGDIVRALGARVDAWLRRRSRPVIFLAGLVLVVGLGYVDLAAGPEHVTPILFYLVPSTLVAWYAGRGPGGLMACAAGLAWLLTEALTHGAYATPSLPHWNGALRLGALLVVSEAVARLRAAIERERELARIDGLTGVANLRSFYERAATEITRARRYVPPFTVAHADLDEFQRINDQLGHVAGDAVLRSAARAIGRGASSERRRRAPGRRRVRDSLPGDRFGAG